MSQAPMSLISTASSASSLLLSQKVAATVAVNAAHQHQPAATLITVATVAEGASGTEQQDLFLSTDFVLDGSFNIDFLLPVGATSAAADSYNHNNNNSHNGFSIESPMMFESFDADPASAASVGQLLEEDFIQNLDVNALLDEAAQAVIQSPGLDMMIKMPMDEEEIQLDASLELQSLLETIANETTAAQDDGGQIDSPSAEITYSHLALTSQQQDQEATMSSVDSVRSLLAADETASWSLEDDTSSSLASLPPASKVVRRSSKGSVTKVTKSKKESNKAAAERYRNKKQQEKLQLFAECEEHEKRNKELKAEIEEVQTELNFIKNLLVEALLSKNKS